MFAAIATLQAPPVQGGAIAAPIASSNRTVVAGHPLHDPRTQDPASFAARPEPRALARRADFGYPTYGTPAAEAFLDRVTAESRSRVVRSLPDKAADYLTKPRSTLVATYADMLRSGKPEAAAAYRAAACKAFDSRSIDEGRRLDDWFDHVQTFLRRMADMAAEVSRQADDNTRPFARAEATRQIDNGVQMLRAESAVPPVRATVRSVLQQAGHERNRRVAEIDTFYRQAQAGGSIVGVPCAKRYQTYWLHDGRLIFNDLNAALSMSPRPVFLGYYNYWPTSIRKHKEFQYGPKTFEGERPTTIEYVNADFVRRGWNFADDAITELSTDAAPDGNHHNDRYRLNDGPWQPYPQVTTPELETQKAVWYARLHAEASAAIQG